MNDTQTTDSDDREDELTNSDVQEWAHDRDVLDMLRERVANDEAIEAYETDDEVGFVVTSNWWHEIAESEGLEGPKSLVYETSAYDDHTQRFEEEVGQRASDHSELSQEYLNCPLIVEK